MRTATGAEPRMLPGAWWLRAARGSCMAGRLLPEEDGQTRASERRPRSPGPAASWQEPVAWTAEEAEDNELGGIKRSTIDTVGGPAACS